MLRAALVVVLAGPAPVPVTTPPVAPATTTATSPAPARAATTPAPAPAASTQSTTTPATTPAPAASSQSAATPAAPATATPATATPPAATPPAATPPPSSRRAPADGVDTGVLELRATRPEGGQVSVRDQQDAVLATLSLRPGTHARLDLPPGIYKIDDAARGSRVTVSVDPDARASYVLTPEGGRGVAGERPPPPTRKARGGRPIWKQVVAPVMSSMIPGLGQMINREPAKGLGFLLGTVALGVGAVMLTRVDNSSLSTKGLNGSSFGGEAITATGFGLLTGALHLLYAAQIMDAHAVAAGKRGPNPYTRHKLSLEMGRSATVGVRAGDPAAAFYPDWSMTVMGQVYPRLSVGASDLSIKHERSAARTTLQGGVRIHYRFLERSRLWMGAAIGLILQGSLGRSASLQVDPDSPQPGSAKSFAAIPYGQIDLKFFILDRWSLNLVPRISAPLAGPRFFNGEGERAVSRNALTLELGTGIGVYF